MDPDKAYIFDNLYIPLNRVPNTEPLKRALTFQLAGQDEVIEDGELVGFKAKERFCWDQTDTHFIIPREYPLDFDKLPDLEWVDLRRVTGPRVHIPITATPREHQAEALEAMKVCKSGTVNLACGKGKTVLAFLYAAQLGYPMLGIVDKSALIGGWLEDIREWIGPDYPVGLIKGSRFDWHGYGIVLASVRTLEKHKYMVDPAFRSYFGVVFFDEGHHYSAEIFNRTADMFIAQRFALTATAQRIDNTHFIYQAHLGPVIYQNLDQDLVPHTVFYELDWCPTGKQTTEWTDTAGNFNRGLYCTGLADIEWRNRLIAESITRDVDDGRTVLSLSYTKAQAEALFEAMVKTCPDAVLIHGEDGRTHDERVAALKDHNPVVATFELAKEGLNKKDLDCLTLSNTHSSDNDTQQAWGRTQREVEGKNIPIVRVFVDRQIRMSMKQSRDIKKYLRLVDYPYEEQIVEIQL